MDESGESRPRLAGGVANDSSRGDGGGSCLRRWLSVLLSIWTDLVAVLLQERRSKVSPWQDAGKKSRSSLCTLGRGLRSQHRRSFLQMQKGRCT